MTDQLALVEIPLEPKLTDRQQLALDLVQASGIGGIHADEIGAMLHERKEGRWAHDRGERCQFCGSDGKGVLEALKKKGLVRYRRGTGGVPGHWQAIGAKDERPISALYNEFPEGF